MLPKALLSMTSGKPLASYHSSAADKASPGEELGELLMWDCHLACWLPSSNAFFIPGVHQLDDRCSAVCCSRLSLSEGS